MILLCGIPSEAPLARVASVLEDHGADFEVFNQRAFEAAELTGPGEGLSSVGRLTLGRRSYPLSEITAVYTRLMDDRYLPELAALPDDAPARVHCRTLHCELTRWLEIAPARVVNRIEPMATNSSKPYQLQLIRAGGFDVPETLVTNDPDLVVDFWRRHGRVIYKSISGVRSIVQELDASGIERIGDIRWCPVQFQERVEGTDVRVHVVGEECYGTRITATGTDYRYEASDAPAPRLEPVSLGDQLAARCVSLTRRLGLSFSGIDLRQAPGGRWVCFEVNPCPAFTYYENHTGQPIAAALVRHLCEAGG